MTSAQGVTRTVTRPGRGTVLRVRGLSMRGGKGGRSPRCSDSIFAGAASFELIGPGGGDFALTAINVTIKMSDATPAAKAQRAVSGWATWGNCGAGLTRGACTALSTSVGALA